MSDHPTALAAHARNSSRLIIAKLDQAKNWGLARPQHRRRIVATSCGAPARHGSLVAATGIASTCQQDSRPRSRWAR